MDSIESMGAFSSGGIIRRFCIEKALDLARIMNNDYDVIFNGVLEWAKQFESYIT